MRMSEIQTVLDLLPTCKPVIKSNKGAMFCFIVNETDNVGYDVTLDSSGFSVVNFKREQYSTFVLISDRESLTTKQRDAIRSHIITKYFPELDYLLRG